MTFELKEDFNKMLRQHKDEIVRIINRENEKQIGTNRKRKNGQL